MWRWGASPTPSQSIDAAALGKVGNDAPDTGLVLHPSCAIVLSHFPVFSIWQTNTRDEVVQHVGASTGGEGALIVRPQFVVEVIRLDTASYAFVAALAAGHTLELAAEIATELDSSFDVGAALQTLFSSGGIVGLRLASGVAGCCVGRVSSCKSLRATVGCNDDSPR